MELIVLKASMDKGFQVLENGAPFNKNHRQDNWCSTSFSSLHEGQGILLTLPSQTGLGGGMEKQ